MLTHLDIRDLALFHRVELALRPGLAVLTGETGAGKSILLDALGFTLGWRGRADMVRAGADTGEATAVFALPSDHPARTVMAEAGLPEAEEGELILRRVAGADGRKQGWVNGRRASGEVLRALSEALVELHGQQDDRGLLNPRGHRQLLDGFAGHGERLARLRTLWAARAAAAQRLHAAEGALAKARADEDFLRHATAELAAFAPQPDEDAELDSRRRRMQAAARVGEDVARARTALGPDGAEGPMADALRWLEGAAPGADGLLDEPIATLAQALDGLARAEQQVADALEQLAFDPRELEQVEERLFALRALARKHGVTPDALPALTEELAARLAALENEARDIGALRAACAEAEAAFQAEARRLGDARREAAQRLDAAMAHELAPLKLERARFATELAPAEPGPEGIDAVTFTVATNPGAPPGPLNRIASGGELSRFLLALKACLSSRSEGLTLIFDEIDRGVGGATADAVGRRLQALARGGQVLVVTHSPQVAARAAQHFVVSKSASAGQTRISLRELDPAERVDEIARMLSGDTITDAARAAARELLSG